MQVSVVIPTLNGARYLPMMFQALKQQTVSCEIIVIDSSSDDDTEIIAKKHAHVFKKIPRERFNHGLTRNWALQLCTHEIVVFLSQDALPFNNRSIERLIQPLRFPPIVMSYGRHIPFPYTRPTEFFFRQYSYPPASRIIEPSLLEKEGVKVLMVSNVFAAYRKSILLEVGGFPKVIISEDIVAAHRFIEAGYHIAYVAEATVLHAHHFNLWQLFQRYFSAGVFHAQNQWLSNYKRRRDFLKFAWKQMRFLFYHAPLWIPYALLENLIRSIGLTLGKHYRFLPYLLRKYFSGYPYYWDNAYFGH